MKDMADIQKPTWIIHGVYEEEGIVYHTHGLKDYDSLELELNLSLPEDNAMIFLNIIGLRIANGTIYQDNDVANDLFNLPIIFKEVEGISSDSHERHLRVIFPDANGKFPWDDGCNPDYAKQI